MARPIRRRRSPKLLKLPSNKKRGGKLNSEQILLRQEKAFDLRTGPEAMDYRAIGEALGVSYMTAKRDVSAIQRLKYKDLIEKDEMVLLESNVRYDQLLARWFNLSF